MAIVPIMPFVAVIMTIASITPFVAVIMTVAPITPFVAVIMAIMTVPTPVIGVGRKGGCGAQDGRDQGGCKQVCFHGYGY